MNIKKLLKGEYLKFIIKMLINVIVEIDEYEY